MPEGAIAEVCRAGTFRGNHRRAHRSLKYTFLAEGAALCRLLDSPQDEAGDSALLVPCLRRRQEKSQRGVKPGKRIHLGMDAGDPRSARTSRVPTPQSFNSLLHDAEFVHYSPSRSREQERKTPEKSLLGASSPPRHHSRFRRIANRFVRMWRQQQNVSRGRIRSHSPPPLPDADHCQL